MAVGAHALEVEGRETLADLNARVAGELFAELVDGRVAVCETPSRRAASATPVGGVAEARPPADGPCDARGCREPDERGDGGDGQVAGRP
jgi:hypothetical protein